MAGAASTVLLAEDEPVLLAFLADTLTFEGFDVESANGGSEALIMLERRSFDVVATDVCMPECSGLDVLRQARAVAARPEVVLISAVADVDTVVESLRHGAFDFLQKPFTIPNLVDTVTRAADHHRRMQDLERIGSERRRLADVRRFAASAAHDFRNGLGSIRGLAEMLGYKSDNPKFVRWSDAIMEQVDKLTKTIDYLSRCVRPAPPSPQAVHVIHLLADVVAEMAERYDTRNFVADLDEDLPTVPYERSHLRLALENVIDNAALATADGGTVRVSAGMADDTLVLEIRDEGDGIEESLLEKVFEPFFSTRKDIGCGLGLTLARKVVDEHGGRLTLRSTVGRGTVATVTLPIAA